VVINWPPSRTAFSLSGLLESARGLRAFWVPHLRGKGFLIPLFSHRKPCFSPNFEEKMTKFKTKIGMPKSQRFVNSALLRLQKEYDLKLLNLFLMLLNQRL